MKKINIVDVAAHAGVSKSTISQYLNGRFNYMSDKTQARIKATIATLNYVPNPIARSLKTDKTTTIGVIVRDITGYDSSIALRGIDDFCKENGYNVLIYNTDFNTEREAHALESLKSLRVDGIIIASSGNNAALIARYISTEFPLVQFQMEYEQCLGNIVLSDHRTSAFEATQYLIELGHIRIAFLTQEFEHVRSRRARYLGYLDALTHYGIAADEQLVHYREREHGFVSPLSGLMESPNPPSALFSQHLAITLDVINTLAELQLEIPRDVSVLGFDDIPMVEHFRVPITVIKQDPYQVGIASATLLLDAIEQKQMQAKKITIPCTLVRRDSCAPHLK